MASDFPAANPYAPAPSLPTLGYDRADFPRFVVGMLVVDACFRCLRIFFVVLSILGIVAMGSNDPLIIWGVLEVLTGSLMIIFGLLGDWLVLSRNRKGLVLCWIAMFATVASIVVGLLELPVTLKTQPQDFAAMGTVMLIGAVMVTLCRVALTGGYAVAILMASRCLNRSATEPS